MNKDTPSLYHYTTVSGLKGIIESGCLHATNIRYLNDSKEFIFGLDYFSKIFSSSGKGPSLDKPIYDHLIDTLFRKAFCDVRHGGQELNSFVVSFSSKPDLLSQWRAYGKENAGYCIKFNHKELTYPSDSLPGMISKVQYINPLDLKFAFYELEKIKNECREEILEHIPWVKREDLSEYGRMLERLKTLDERSGSSLSFKIGQDDHKPSENVDMTDEDPAWYSKINEIRVFFIYPTLNNIALTWKDHSFSEEGEYRLAVMRDDRETALLGRRYIRIREGKTFLVPYIEIPYDFSKHHVVEEVIVGPCPHTNEAENALQLLLGIHDIYGVDVRQSKIPYRYW